jgi:threonine aldolase
MIRFNCDYSEGAHPRVLEKLAAANLEQTAGYGMDPYCEKAADLIRELCDSPGAAVHFMVGGTPANLTLIAAALRPHQGAISADTGHIAGHESGAIEATGHKVLTLPNKDGKITAEQIQELYDDHYSRDNHEHIVQPGLVYLSNPTELGTIYSLSELTAISETCRKNGLYLYLDGARLGYGLCAEGSDLSLPDLAKLCDAFYIGGTKQGALFGEALVIRNDVLQKDFRYIEKQKGGMLAKGRLLGLQFLALLEDGLYFELSRHADELAAQIHEAFAKKGFSFASSSKSNQQFPILPDAVLQRLGEKFVYADEGSASEGNRVVRFCTSWATREEDVRALTD